MVKANSSSNADDFQILSEDRGAAYAGSIVRSPKRLQFLAKILAVGSIERGKRLMDGSVVEAKKLHYLRGRKGIAERVMTPDQG